MRKAVGCDTSSRYRSAVSVYVMPVESPVARTAVCCIHNSAVVSDYLGASLLVLCQQPNNFTQEPYGAKSTLSCPIHIFTLGACQLADHFDLYRSILVLASAGCFESVAIRCLVCPSLLGSNSFRSSA
jgi:hypothetical protein